MLKNLAVLLFPLIGLSQSHLDSNRSGIHFQHLDSWQRVLAKAKAEKKFIFLDCYTTWCGPCKRMDKEIFPLPSVGNIYNKHFISIKVQMDRTLRDSDEIKQWYQDADSIKAWYKVESYPTYLFFSPDGKAVHRALGAVNAEQFQSFALDALDPQKQYYALEAKFANETKFDLKSMSNAELKHLAISYKYNHPEISGNMALEYIRRLKTKSDFKNNYDFISQFNKNVEIAKIAAAHIQTLSNEEMLQLYSRENFSFFTHFMKSSKDRLFSFLMKNVKLVDSVMNKNYDYQVQDPYMWINSIIRKDEIIPWLEKAGASPDWNKLYHSLKDKYGEPYASMNLHNAKMEWFSAQKDEANYTKQRVLYMDKFGGTLESGWYLNSYAWEMFQLTDNKDKLLKALSWSGRAILNDPLPNHMDTYANILYKLGKKQRAIVWEEKALTLDPKNKEFQSNLNKMKNDQPTW